MLVPRIPLICLLGSLWALQPYLAAASIPAGERTDLEALYTNTNGGGWTDSSKWCVGACPATGAPTFNTGMECTWKGVTCDVAQAHVTAIQLPDNHLTGALPQFKNFSALQTFIVSGNRLTGSSLDLSYIAGSVQTVDVSFNYLDGTIPALAYATPLEYYDASYNTLTGNVPSLQGLPNLHVLFLNFDNLTGTIPTFSGAQNISVFNIEGNRLTGVIPPLSGLAKLSSFSVTGNGLTGSIPSLNGLATLQFFYVDSNQLTGSIPSLSGLSELDAFDVHDNHLTGTIPPLSDLVNLTYLDISHNQLTGPIPSFSGLNALEFINIENNQLSGLIPAAPLAIKDATLCPNPLTIETQPQIDAVWDEATGYQPWWATPSVNNSCDELFGNGFDAP